MLPANNKEIKIDITDAAFKQIKLISDNDYTLEGMDFRLKVDGKGCDGFTYATGFSEKVKDDITLEYLHDGLKLSIIVDPFSSHYCRDGLLDFFLNTKENEDGFTFTNHNEHEHQGKFFEDTSKLPPIQ